MNMLKHMRSHKCRSLCLLEDDTVVTERVNPYEVRERDSGGLDFFAELLGPDS